MQHVVSSPFQYIVKVITETAPPHVGIQVRQTKLPVILHRASCTSRVAPISCPSGSTMYRRVIPAMGGELSLAGWRPAANPESSVSHSALDLADGRRGAGGGSADVDLHQRRGQIQLLNGRQRLEGRKVPGVGT